MEHTEQVVAVISECVVKAVKQLLADYDTQLNNKLKNIKITGDNIKPLSISGTNIASGSITGANIGAGAIGGGNIADGAITGTNIAEGAIGSNNIAAGAISSAQLGDISDQVMQTVEQNIYSANITWGNIENLNAAAADIAKAEIENAEIDTAQIANLKTEVMNTVVANIDTAEIDWANIEKLSTATADIAAAKIENAKITTAQITDLKTTVSDMTHAEIESADITFGQIKDFVGGTAIITRGVAGQFYIKDLAVTAANINELTLGKLMMVKDESTGEFYNITIDEDGEVVAEVVKIDNDNLADGAVTGNNIANGTITGGNIANGAISGGNIANGAVTADNLNVGAVFGDEAVMLNITASMGKFADLFANNMVAEQLKTHLLESDYLKILIQDSVEIGARNLVKQSNVAHSNSDYIVATYDFGDSPPEEGELVTIRIKGSLGEGKSCFNICNSGENLSICNLEDNGDGTYSKSSVVWHTQYVDADGNTLTVDNSYILVRAMEEAVTGVISSIDWIMVERGTQASDWSPAPEDTLDATDQLEGKIDSVAQQIMTPEQIVTTVRSDARYNNDLQQLQTTVTQNNTALEIRISKAENDLSNVSDTVNETKNNLDTWYHFGADALVIGKSDSEYKTRQSNESYEFLYNETPVATLSGDMFEAPKMSVSDEFRFGGLCAVVDKTTGDIEWVWRGMPATATNSFSLQ